MESLTADQAREINRGTKNSSAVSALVVAIILHVIVGAVLFAVLIVNPFKKKADLVIISPPHSMQQDVQMRNFSNAVQQKPPSSASQMTKVITANNMSPITAPIIDEVNEQIIDIGTGFGLGAGAGWGDSGLGMGGTMPPGSILRDRCTAKDRAARLAKWGGSNRTEEAVVKGLRYLQETQKEDGSWGSGHPVAMTGLALLAFLGHCETPDSKEFGETVKKAIVYLANKAIGDNGRLLSKVDRHWPYEHGIGTYAICEAFSLMRYGRIQIPSLKEAVELSVPIIIDGQNPDGGWVYNYEGSGAGDVSIAGWQLQALKAASLTGLEFPRLRRCVRKALSFLEDMQGREGGFGYRSKGDRWALTGVGCLSLQMHGRPGSSTVRRGVRFILKQDIDYDKNMEIYGWYYNTQACFQAGGKSWEKWNAMYQEQLLDKQADNGSWLPEGGKGGPSSAAAGPDAEVYRTCLCILMLEVFYRYLPATS